MIEKRRKPLWLGVMLAVVLAIVLAGPALIAGISDTANAAGGCHMGGESSGAGCSMKGGSGGCTMEAEQAASEQCALLVGTAVAVDSRDGSMTVKVKPAAPGADVTRKALSYVKKGDTLAMGIMISSNGKPAPVKAAALSRSVSYACPMHPDVTANKPGQCPKCGMDLVRTKQ